MKTHFTSALLFCALTSAPALAQSKTAARPAATPKATTAKTATASKTTVRPVAAKPVSTAARSTVKPTAKPATQAATSKPVAAAPAPVMAEAPRTTVPAPEVTVAKKAASDQLFVKGSKALNVGAGLGLGYGYTLSGGHSLPALSASLEYGIADNVGPGTIGVGGMVGYKSFGWKSGGYKGTWSNIIVAARGTYHYNVFDNPKLDTYAGISLGVRHERYSDNSGLDSYYDKTSSTYLTSGLFVGGRYYFSDKIGAFGEVGYDMSLLKLGLTARF